MKLYRFYVTGLSDHGSDVGITEYETVVMDGKTFINRPWFGLQEVTKREWPNYYETREEAARAAASKLTGIASALLQKAEQLREEAAGV